MLAKRGQCYKRCPDFLIIKISHRASEPRSPSLFTLLKTDFKKFLHDSTYISYTVREVRRGGFGLRAAKQTVHFDKKTRSLKALAKEFTVTVLLRATPGRKSSRRRHMRHVIAARSAAPSLLPLVILHFLISVDVYSQ